MAEVGFLSITEAVPELNMTRQGVWHNIMTGVIKATKVGSTYVIPEKEIHRVRRQRIQNLEKEVRYLRGREK